MKNYSVAIATIAFLLAGSAAHAARQPKSPDFKVENELFVFEKISPVELSKKEIITQAAAFIAAKFVSARSVIQLQDAELGKIVGDVILHDRDARMLAAFKGVKVRITIDAKDGRYRLQATNIVGIDGNGAVSPWGEVESANQYRIEPLAAKLLNDFEQELTSHLKTAKAAENW
jgi:hypothetical protein